MNCDDGVVGRSSRDLVLSEQRDLETAPKFQKSSFIESQDQEYSSSKIVYRRHVLQIVNATNRLCIF